MHAPLRAKPRRRVEQEEELSSSDDEVQHVPADGAKKPMQILMEDVDAAADGSAAIDDEEDAPMDQLEVNFEFQEPQETDYHSVKQFSQTLLHGTKFDHAGLADYVLALSKARHIGTVLKVKESLDGETFGFISVIAVSKTRHLEFTKQIMHYMVAKATTQNPDLGARLRHIFEDRSQPVGIILSARMLNVPPEIGMHLHQTLMQEIEQAADHDKESYGFQNFVLLSGFYEEVKEKGAQKKKAQRAEGAGVYFREEEQMYAKAATLSFTFPVMHHDRTTRWSFAGTVRETAQVLVVPRDRIAAVLHSIEELMK